MISDWAYNRIYEVWSLHIILFFNSVFKTNMEQKIMVQQDWNFLKKQKLLRKGGKLYYVRKSIFPFESRKN